jgi:hypothetical protein
MGEFKKEYEASLKSIETENLIDRIFYRPIGFRIACLLRKTVVTPNMTTIVSIFVGVFSGMLFYSTQLSYNLLGIMLLIVANILDCVDGQLARLTGIKSEIGRILDGIAGDLWFASIYVSLALRLSQEEGVYWCFLPAALAGLSHLMQANIVDYYKTLHLYFISKEKGAEFSTLEQVRRQHKETKLGINKTFYLLYRAYTLLQVKATPTLQRMLRKLHARYGDNIPQDIRGEFRKVSKQLMPLIDLMTFNGRTIILFIALLTGYIWIYLFYEIMVLNIILAIVMKKHEKLCASFYHSIVP